MKKIFLMLAFTFLCASTVYAADTLYRFCSNDHDMLIIGKVTAITDETITAKIKDRIISKQDLNMNAKKKQLVVDNVNIERESIYSELNLKVDDIILASLNKKGNTYVSANGVYKVDKADKDTLTILEPAFSKTNNKAIECFIHSNGTITNFYFEYENAAYKDENGNEVIIYDASMELTPEEKKENEYAEVSSEIEAITETKDIKFIIPTIIIILVLFISIICIRTFIVAPRRK